MNSLIITVLGPGRSGTSLIMQILHKFGAYTSKNINPTSVANPIATYEDIDIFQLQNSLIKDLNASVIAPLPEGWIREKATIRTINRLSSLIQNRLIDNPSIFAFKDPKTSIFIPMWNRIFNKLKISPIYILAIRNPSTTIASYLRQYNQPSHMAELIWITRTISALEDTSSDCFIMHYEDWFERPEKFANDLIDYTQLRKNFNGDIDHIVKSTIKSNLNRASIDKYKTQTPIIIKLYSALTECRGTNFDRQKLLSVVKECRQEMNTFQGWYQLGHQANIKLDNIQEQLKKANSELTRIKELETRIEQLELEKKQQVILNTQIQQLRTQMIHFINF